LSDSSERGDDVDVDEVGDDSDGDGDESTRRVKLTFKAVG
jgi:hypothetical protein